MHPQDVTEMVQHWFPRRRGAPFRCGPVATAATTTKKKQPKPQRGSRIAITDVAADVVARSQVFHRRGASSGDVSTTVAQKTRIRLLRLHGSPTSTYGRGFRWVSNYSLGVMICAVPTYNVFIDGHIVFTSNDAIIRALCSYTILSLRKRISFSLLFRNMSARARVHRWKTGKVCDWENWLLYLSIGFYVLGKPHTLGVIEILELYLLEFSWW